MKTKCIYCLVGIEYSSRKKPLRCEKCNKKRNSERTIACQRKRKAAEKSGTYRPRTSNKLPLEREYVEPPMPKKRDGYCDCGVRLSVADDGTCVNCKFHNFNDQRAKLVRRIHMASGPGRRPEK